MKWKLFPRPIKWDEVREQILKAIEEEERRNEAIIIPSAEGDISISPSQPQMDTKHIGVVAGTADSGLINEGRMQ